MKEIIGLCVNINIDMLITADSKKFCINCVSTSKNLELNINIAENKYNFEGDIRKTIKIDKLKRVFASCKKKLPVIITFDNEGISCSYINKINTTKITEKYDGDNITNLILDIKPGLIIDNLNNLKLISKRKDDLDIQVKYNDKSLKFSVDDSDISYGDDKNNDIYQKVEINQRTGLMLSKLGSIFTNISVCISDNQLGIICLNNLCELKIGILSSSIDIKDNNEKMIEVDNFEEEE